jgi:hypothetical protein
LGVVDREFRTRMFEAGDHTQKKTPSILFW